MCKGIKQSFDSPNDTMHKKLVTTKIVYLMHVVENMGRSRPNRLGDQSKRDKPVLLYWIWKYVKQSLSKCHWKTSQIWINMKSITLY